MPVYKQWWVKLLVVMIIFPLSFICTDYYYRGYLYYSKRVINRLYEISWEKIFPPTGDVTYSIYAIADNDYRQKYPDWKNHIQQLMGNLDKRYSEEFGINFTASDIDEWNPPGNISEFSDLLTLAAKSVNRKGAEILVVFTGKQEPVEEGQHFVDIGIAHYLGNCIVVGEDGQLLHETGHLFGAVDYPFGDSNFTTQSIYSYKYTRTTDKIDTLNHDRILQHKYRAIW